MGEGQELKGEQKGDPSVGSAAGASRGAGPSFWLLGVMAGGNLSLLQLE